MDDEGASALQDAEGRETLPARCPDNYVIGPKNYVIGPKYVPAPEREEGRRRSRGKVAAVRHRLEGDQALQPRHRSQGVSARSDLNNPKTLIVETQHHRLQACKIGGLHSARNTSRASERRSWSSTTAPAPGRTLPDLRTILDNLIAQSGIPPSSSSHIANGGGDAQGTNAARSTTT